MNTWEGKKVRLRALEPEEWEIHFQWNQDPDMPRNLEFIWFPQSRAAVKKWAEETALKRSEDDKSNLVIETLAGEYAGTISVYRAEQRSGTFEYGIAVRPQFQRKGYASEAITILLRHYFNELRYQKVNVHVYDYNQASITLHERLGFQLEGHLRRMHYSNGQYHDTLIYGLTDNEFRAQNTE